MKAYSQDLRDRVINAHQSQLSITKIAELFSMCGATVRDWVKRFEATGDYRSKQGTVGGPNYKFDNKASIIEFINKNPDADGISIRDAVAPTLAMSTFYDTLHRMGITYKKRAKIQRA